MTRAHPLDPLSVAEIEASVAAVRAAARSTKVWQHVSATSPYKLKN